jgi:hypothetical protein
MMLKAIKIFIWALAIFLLITGFYLKIINGNVGFFASEGNTVVNNINLSRNIILLASLLFFLILFLLSKKENRK